MKVQRASRFEFFAVPVAEGILNVELVSVMGRRADLVETLQENNPDVDIALVSAWLDRPMWRPRTSQDAPSDDEEAPALGAVRRTLYGIEWIPEECRVGFVPLTTAFVAQGDQGVTLARVDAEGGPQ